MLTTVNAIVQSVPPRDFIAAASLKLQPGNVMSMQALIERLEISGYARAGTVTDPGQYAVRGGILDLYPPGGEPIRLDFFGDTLEQISAFDPDTQRTEARRESLQLLPMSEMALTPEVRSAFRQRYVALFGPVTGDDPLYESISAGRQHQGMEHWLPLFHDRLATLFDYLPGAAVTLDPLVDDARAKRLEQIADHYDARAQALERKAFGAPPYHPVPPESMFLSEAEWQAALSDRHVVAARSVRAPGGARRCRDRLLRRQARPLLRRRAPDRRRQRVRCRGRSCQAAQRRRQAGDRRLLEQRRARAAGDAACRSTASARPSASSTFAERPASSRARPLRWPCCRSRPGFEAPGLAVIGEQDILGDRLVRRTRGKRGSDVLTEVSSLSVGDLVVHSDHGIGRFAGLATIEAAGKPHDCLEVHYQGGDKLYLPVENIELLSRYGSDEAGAQLDRLGGVAWQTRKAGLKKRIRDMAEKLIKVAALRALHQAPVLDPARRAL